MKSKTAKAQAPREAPVWMRALHLGQNCDELVAKPHAAPPLAGAAVISAFLDFPEKCVPFLTGDAVMRELTAMLGNVLPPGSIVEKTAESVEDDSEKTENTKKDAPPTCKSSWLWHFAFAAPRVLESVFAKPLLPAEAKDKLLKSLCADHGNRSSNKASSEQKKAATGDTAPSTANNRDSLAEQRKRIPLVALALQRRTGWVATAAWKAASLVSVREEMANLLVRQEKELREENIAVWRACELHAWKTRHSEWREKHEKADKRRKTFADILSFQPKNDSRDQDKSKQPGALDSSSKKRKRSESSTKANIEIPAAEPQTQSDTPRPNNTTSSSTAKGSIDVAVAVEGKPPLPVSRTAEQSADKPLEVAVSKDKNLQAVLAFLHQPAGPKSKKRRLNAKR
ncbi:unnamed protein product [Amoebophrya sp. A25]|nr:unnamed protein product [Amoebophrya sp. A25]|eukprot:GSA25T00001060001.1